MTIAMQGLWTVSVKRKSAAWPQRFRIQGSTNGVDGVYDDKSPTLDETLDPSGYVEISLAPSDGALRLLLRTLRPGPQNQWLWHPGRPNPLARTHRHHV